jgi:xylulokinase
LTSQINPAEVLGIGLSGQSWSAVPVDKTGEVLANTPIWMDTSAAPLCRELADAIDPARLLAICGNPLQPAYSTPKIAQFARTQPGLYRDTAWFLQSNSFIGLRLTRVVSQDQCQSFGLHVFDTMTGEYDQGVADALGIDLAKLPQPVACHEVIGQVTPDAAAATGLAVRTPVVAGGLDAACATLGVGVWRPGEAQEQGGQAGGMSLVTDRPVADARLILSRHVVPGTWLLQGGTVAGGASLQWACEQIGCPDLDFAQISTLAATVAPGSGGVWYLPYLAGERSPLWDPAACGVFFGLRLTTTRAALFRAVMEGVAYSLLDNLTVAAAAGAPCRELTTSGGAAQSAVWTGIKADITGCRIHVPATDQASTFGAALLAGVGVGAYPAFAEAVRVIPPAVRTHVPASRAVYTAGFGVYRELYHQLKPLMAATAAAAATATDTKGSSC